MRRKLHAAASFFAQAKKKRSDARADAEKGTPRNAHPLFFPHSRRRVSTAPLPCARFNYTESTRGERERDLRKPVMFAAVAAAAAALCKVNCARDDDNDRMLIGTPEGIKYGSILVFSFPRM